MNNWDAGGPLCVFNCIHDPGVGATGKDDEPFAFYGEYHSLFTLEIIRLKMFITCNKKSGARLSYSVTRSIWPVKYPLALLPLAPLFPLRSDFA